MIAAIKTLSDRSRTWFRQRVLPSDQHRRQNIFGVSMLIPAFLFLVVFVMLPVLYVINLSLHEIGIFAESGEFVGLSNYAELLADGRFHNALWNGVVYALSSVAFQVLLGLTLALALSSDFVGSSFARTVAIFPYLVPLITVIIMWRWMLNPNYGVINYYLVVYTPIQEPINFFGSSLAMPSIIASGGWKLVPFATLVFLARLQAIDHTLYEQAATAGASRIQMFRYITLPNLRSAILLVVLLRIVWNFNHFSLIWLFTRGGPLEKTTTLPIYIYKEIFQQFNLGMGSAAAIILFAVLVVFAIIYFRVFKPSEELKTRQ